MLAKCVTQDCASSTVVVLPWLRSLTWRVGMRLMLVARSLLVTVSPPVLPILGGMRSVGVNTPDVSWSSASSSSSSAVFQVGMLFKYFDQWGSITSNRFVLKYGSGAPSSALVPSSLVPQCLTV